MSKYADEFKLEVTKHYVSGQDGFQVTADKFSVSRSLERNWVDVYKCLGAKGFDPRQARRKAQSKIAILNQIQSEGLFLREACRRFSIAAASSISMEKNMEADVLISEGHIKPAGWDSVAPSMGKPRLLSGR